MPMQCTLRIAIIIAIMDIIINTMPIIITIVTIDMKEDIIEAQSEQVLR
tara:strand:+ start:39 stop:185 length:147 start_codon:yes stop_codon:yes gene_type:complete